MPTNNKINNHISNEIKPEEIIEWKDSCTDAIGWIVINSKINRIAGGGLFMHSAATLSEVKDLAKGMSYKNAILDTPIMGGGKGGIRFNHQDPEAKNVLSRFIQGNKSILKHKWCTGGDLYTNNNEIETFAQDAGLDGAFSCLSEWLTHNENIPNQSKKMNARLATPINQWFNLGDSATGYIISQIIKTIHLGMPKIIIQGFGKVGSSLAYFIQNLGLGTIVGIYEIDGYIYNNEGIDIYELLTVKEEVVKNTSIVPTLRNILNQVQRIKYNWTSTKNDSSLRDFLALTNADIFCPCATRYCIDLNEIKQFIRNGRKQYIISGANRPFSGIEVVQYCLNNNITIVPDWLSSCGNALLFVEILRCTNWNERNYPFYLLDKINSQVQKFLNSSIERQQTESLSLFQSCHLQIKQKLNLLTGVIS